MLHPRLLATMLLSPTFGGPRIRSVHGRLPLCHGLRAFELSVRLGASWACVGAVLSVSARSGDNNTKTSGPRIFEEEAKVHRRYTREREPLIHSYRWVKHPLVRLRTRLPRMAEFILVRSIELLAGGVLGSIYGFGRHRTMNSLNRYNITPSGGGLHV